MAPGTGLCTALSNAQNRQPNYEHHKRSRLWRGFTHRAESQVVNAERTDGHSASIHAAEEADRRDIEGVTFEAELPLGIEAPWLRRGAASQFLTIGEHNRV